MKKLVPNEEVANTKHFTVYQDWEVPIPAFFILAPKRKIMSITDFSDEEASEFISLLRQIRKGMKDTLGIKNAYFFQNEDAEHNFHFWIFPRYKWMEKFGRKIQSVRPIMEYAKENMVTDSTVKEVKDCVKKMKRYMSSN